MRIDLQLHSTYSDGYLTPTELAEMAQKFGIKVVALTDHDTVAGQEEFLKACEARGIKAIIGIELYVKLNNKKFNILWYNFDKSHPDLHKVLRQCQIRRRASVRKILEKLKERGFEVDAEKILDQFNHYVPINKIVGAFAASGKNIEKIKKELGTDRPQESEMIRNYFRNKVIGVLRESYINIKRILKLREKIGGQIILNHPGKFNQINREFFAKLKAVGIDGVEILSPHHSIGAVMYAQYLARENKFMETGGSDFHLHEGNGHLIQNSLEYFIIDSEKLRDIEKVINNQPV